MNHKFTLVPSSVFSEENSREILSEVVPLDDGEPLSFLDVPAKNAVLVYAGTQRPVIYDMLISLFKIRDYNKILASYSEGWLNLVIAQEDNLLLCNCFRADDFVTAQYYIFLCLNKFQINPQVSTIFFFQDLEPEKIISLSNYFKSAEVLQ